MKAARTCDISLPVRIGTDETDESEVEGRLDHQFVAEKTDEVWQQAQPFVTDAFSLDTTRERIPTGSTHHYQIGTLS